MSGDTAIAEKFVVHEPELSQLLIDMKLMYRVVPTDIPEVGMIPVSAGANLMLLMTCLDSGRSLVRNIVLYRHCLPRTLK